MLRRPLYPLSYTQNHLFLFISLVLMMKSIVKMPLAYMDQETYGA